MQKEVSPDHLLNWYDSCEANLWSDQVECETWLVGGSKVQEGDALEGLGASCL